MFIRHEAIERPKRCEKGREDSYDFDPPQQRRFSH
jgi:hypothetical protein